MRKFRKLMVAALVVAMAAATATSFAGTVSAADEDTVTLRFSSQHAETNSTYLAIQHLADEVFEKTEGRVKIEIYGNSQLGAATENLTMLDTDVCDMVWTSSAFFAGQFPYSEAMELPMMGIKNSIDGTNIYWDVMEKFPEQFTEFDDYYVWCAYVAPATCIGATNVMIESISDLAGLNLRAAAGNNAAAVTAWGAAPVAIAPSDLYMALQKGVADGWTFNASTLDSWKLGEITKSVIDCGLSYSQIFMLASKDDIEKLSEEDQAVLAEVGGRAGSLYMAEQTEQEANDAIKHYTEAGGTFTVVGEGDALYEELAAPLAGIVDEWIARVSTDDFDATQVVEFIKERVAEY